MHDTESFQGFIVNAYPDFRRNQLYCVGRLDDNRSFAAVEAKWRPYIHIFENDRERALSLLAPSMRLLEIHTDLQSFSGTERLCRLDFHRYADRAKAAALLDSAAIHSPDAGIKPADLFLMERYIRGPVALRGRALPGRRVDLVIHDPVFSVPETAAAVPLRVASIDIETDVKSGLIRAVSVAWTDTLAAHMADNAANNRKSGAAADQSAQSGLVRVVAPDTHSAAQKEPALNGPQTEKIVFHDDERSLLSAFVADIQRIDPDVLTGWNVLDFDFARLSERCERLHIPFTVGRSSEPAKFLPGAAPDGDEARQWRRRSAAAIVPGRQVLDALRIIRAGTWGMGAAYGGAGGLRGSWGDEGAADFSLETVSRIVLGEGKIVHSSGDEKIAELDALYAADPRRFGEYCLRDAELVLLILAKTGLFRLTLERALLTGVSIDKAWTSVVSFERVYGTELLRKGIAPPAPDPDADVSGASGGTVLEPQPGLFDNVAVFDFRSLYPTIMLTFNIDPLAHARAKTDAGRAAPGEGPIVAPNGAVFSRRPGLLPALISGYFAARRAAIDAGDSIAAQVYKILMNSFYGVLGTGACRYGRTQLAGSITSFARKWLFFSRDWFTEQGFRVLYGDTDSLFVETTFGDDASYDDFANRCGSLAEQLNRRIAGQVRAEYDLESCIELRFEKAYRRFLIPPLRNFGTSATGAYPGSPEARGRAKGYGGYLLQPGPADGPPRISVEVKGMEAVRSDSTPLARRLQLELLELAFSGCSEAAFREKVRQTIAELRTGTLDGELVYRKRLARYPETYVASTPPQVKAARALGWIRRRGTVEYIWTVNGPEPVAIPHGTPDYDHYVDSQIAPVARSIAAAAGWDESFFSRPGGRAAACDCTEGQMELTFSETV